MPQVPDRPSPVSAAGGSDSAAAVAGGIRRAARATNVDFGYLMAQAGRESGFQPTAASSTSSAAGLFQFVESTWLDMVQRHGAKHGLGDLAQQIETRNGRPTVADPALKQRILGLRNDPGVSACLAAELARDNKEELTRSLGRPVGSADLYLAHFLGAGGACQFLRAVETNGSQKAADLLPEAAAANRSVFYDRQTGAARSVADVYRTIAGQIEGDSRRYAGAGGAGIGSAGAADMSFGTAAATTAAGDYTAMLGGALGQSGSGSMAAAPWNAGKLSEPMLTMLNILALSVLQTTDASTGRQDDSSHRAVQTPPAAAATGGSGSTADDGHRPARSS